MKSLLPILFRSGYPTLDLVRPQSHHSQFSIILTTFSRNLLHKSISFQFLWSFMSQ